MLTLQLESIHPLQPGTAEGIIVSIQYRECEFQMVYGHGEYAIPVEIHTPPLNGILVGIHTPTAEGIMSTFNTEKQCEFQIVFLSSTKVTRGHFEVMAINQEPLH